MSPAESRAQSIILVEIGRDVSGLSYQQLLERSYTGYTDFYLQKTANLIKLTTTAKLSVVLELAECDLSGIENFENKVKQFRNSYVQSLHLLG